ncbi:30S ribosomal protein S15 [Candidatus Amoebophilus asiaticus]|nr:30S ribosomal protein S15 [Candidatus Amoebophilus asiaticus]
MYLAVEKKTEIFKKYGSSAKDTGSPESQVALFTYRIKHLTEHLKQNKKDHSTKLALTKLVGKRRKLLDYITTNDIEKYRQLIKELKLRR